MSQIQQSNLRLSERLDSLERRTRQEVSGDQYQHHDHVIMQTTETYNLQLMMIKFYLSFIRMLLEILMSKLGTYQQTFKYQLLLINRNSSVHHMPGVLNKNYYVVNVII